MEPMMAGIDDSRAFFPLNIAVMTMSDTRTAMDDTSGDTLVERMTNAGHNLAARTLLPDDVNAIAAQMRAWIADDGIDAIVATGGTGFAKRDVTPEAVRPLFDKEMDGFSVVFHQVSLTTVGLSTLQSRALAGQAGDTFIYCLPGSTGACKDAWDHILAFHFDSRYRPCSIVGQIPRYRGLC
jgi:molybdopterin adenylyltransferase